MVITLAALLFIAIFYIAPLGQALYATEPLRPFLPGWVPIEYAQSASFFVTTFIAFVALAVIVNLALDIFADPTAGDRPWSGLQKALSLRGAEPLAAATTLGVLSISVASALAGSMNEPLLVLEAVSVLALVNMTRSVPATFESDTRVDLDGWKDARQAPPVQDTEHSDKSDTSLATDT